MNYGKALRSYKRIASIHFVIVFDRLETKMHSLYRYSEKKEIFYPLLCIDCLEKVKMLGCRCVMIALVWYEYRSSDDSADVVMVMQV